MRLKLLVGDWRYNINWFFHLELGVVIDDLPRATLLLLLGKHNIIDLRRESSVLIYTLVRVFGTIIKFNLSRSESGFVHTLSVLNFLDGFGFRVSCGNFVVLFFIILALAFTHRRSFDLLIPVFLRILVLAR